MTEQQLSSGVDNVFRRRQKENCIKCELLMTNSGGAETEKPGLVGNAHENEQEVKLKGVSSMQRVKSVLQCTLWIILCLIAFVHTLSLVTVRSSSESHSGPRTKWRERVHEAIIRSSGSDIFGEKPVETNATQQMLLMNWCNLYFKFYERKNTNQDGFIQLVDIWGASGATILLFAGPVFLLVFGGTVYLYFSKSARSGERKRKETRASLGTHPVIVSGPLGVVTAAEVLCISALLMIVSCIMFIYLFHDFQKLVEEYPEATPAFRWIKRVKKVALRFGWVGEFCLGLLFVPVSRGSVLLRLIDIPFEHAVKYHVWLGHCTMTLFTLHGLCFIVPWYFEGRLDKMLHWKDFGIAIVPGEIALVAGMLMWITSFQFTRIRAFELFFYTHHLYIVFVVFMLLHVGDSIVGIAFAGIFLFAFDRFLRFCQSRKEVGVLSATLLPCGAFELVLPKPSGLTYNELSFVFLNVPSIDLFQSHPFSVSSSPEDTPHNMKFLIKPFGTWTRNLGNAVKTAAISQCPLGLNARVEGPYGHETSYFLDYETLLLVAGGIGVSPFVAIIRDLLHRYKKNETGLPRDVTLVWAVKNHKELGILDSLRPNSIYPDYAGTLKLSVKAYVTQELLEDLEEGETEVGLTHMQTRYDSTAEQKTMSHLVASGNILWTGAATAASTLGYIVFTGLVGYFYLYPNDNGSYKLVPWWIRGLIVLAGMVVGIVIFGGTVIILWHRFGYSTRKVVSKGLEESKLDEPLLNSSHESAENFDTITIQKLVQHSNTVYGVRPDVHDIFKSCAKRFAGSSVGVLVCGPAGMQSSVAEQCRAFNTILYNSHRTAFSYHSVSFDL